MLHYLLRLDFLTAKGPVPQGLQMGSAGPKPELFDPKFGWAEPITYYVGLS